jgi:4-hydroxy-3-polyprenylbenzoate decarboxylase
MPYKSLSHFVDTLDRKGMLLRVKEFVDPVLEIAEVTDRFTKLHGPTKALLFENTGTNFPVLTNVFGSEALVSVALGVESADSMSGEILKLFEMVSAPRETLLQKLSMLPTLGKMARWLPKTVQGKGACQEVVHMSPALSQIPILQCWPLDGGRFVTLPMVHTRDPKTGSRNVGMYRMQVFGENLTGMHWHRHKTGARHMEEYRRSGELMPVAVAIGGDPAYTYSATAPLPDNIDEYILAGFIRNKRVRLVKCLTVDLEVPEDVDFVIEGFVDPQEEPIWEGPFGDHTGFYSLADWYPKFHVTCITHRKNAIYPATIVGVPPMEDAYLAQITERIFLSPIRFAIAPEMCNMYLPPEGVAHNIAIVSINKSYPGQAYKVGNALWGAGQMMFNKIMVVVDKEVDVRNPVEVAQAMAENFNPLTDVLTGKGPLDILDHSSEKFSYGGKILIDATKKLPEERNGAAMFNRLDAEKISEALNSPVSGAAHYNMSLMSMGIPILIVGVDKTLGLTTKSIAHAVLGLLQGGVPKMLVMVDHALDTSDVEQVAWFASGNMDALRDCWFVTIEHEKVPCLVIDGTRKCYATDNFPRQWPNVVVSSKETIDRVDAKWSKLGLGPLIKSPSLKYLHLNHGNEAMVSPFL